MRWLTRRTEQPESVWLKAGDLRIDLLSRRLQLRLKLLQPVAIDGGRGEEPGWTRACFMNLR